MVGIFLCFMFYVFFIYSFFERASERVGGLAGAVLKTAVGFVFCFFLSTLSLFFLPPFFR